jgi:hypothetical protein
MTAMDYAWLCSQLTIAPERAGEAMARYGLDLNARAALDRAWQQRFEREPGLRGEWVKLFAAYRRG